MKNNINVYIVAACVHAPMPNVQTLPIRYQLKALEFNLSRYLHGLVNDMEWNYMLVTYF